MYNAIYNNSSEILLKLVESKGNFLIRQRISFSLQAKIFFTSGTYMFFVVRLRPHE